MVIANTGLDTENTMSKQRTGKSLLYFETLLTIYKLKQQWQGKAEEQIPYHYLTLM
jgi:hypothetical protein